MGQKSGFKEPMAYITYPGRTFFATILCIMSTGCFAVDSCYFGSNKTKGSVSLQYGYTKSLFKGNNISIRNKN